MQDADDENEELDKEDDLRKTNRRRGGWKISRLAGKCAETNSSKGLGKHLAGLGGFILPIELVGIEALHNQAGL